MALEIHQQHMLDLRVALTSPDVDRRSRASAFKQMRAREEVMGVAPEKEPAAEFQRYLDGELTLGELVDLRLRPGSFS